MLRKPTSASLVALGEPRRIDVRCARDRRGYFRGIHRAYDITPDGQQSLMIERREMSRVSSQIHVVVNWTEELKRLVPTGNN